ncbi:MAG: hypothetical protein BGO69_17710 [Bacteroidetes bacterium 46-16]|nr:MAG: hypothetical protein BGO69_17710 [Bacteroidetes bacterium 46-16]
MRLLLLTGFSLICLALHAQSMSDALKLFEQGQLDSAIAISKRYTQTEPGAYQVIGQSLVKQGKYTEAIPYLEKGKNTVNARLRCGHGACTTWVSPTLCAVPTTVLKKISMPVSI